MQKLLRILAATLLAAGPLTAFAVVPLPNIQITEWMYNGNGATGEYVEFTNLGSTAVDFNGWSYDDSSRTPGSVSLTAFGSVNPGQSVILAEADATTFRSAWNLAASVKVIGGNTNNLGRSDEINLYDNNLNPLLIDRLTYGDAVFAGTIRAQNFSGNPLALADLEPQAIAPNWVLASVGDAYGSYASTLGDVGNPGAFALAVPEPSAYTLLLAGLGLIAGIARRRAA